MATKNNKSHIIDFHKAKCIAGIVEVLEGMDPDYLEDILLSMLRERDTTVEAMVQKREILNRVRWSYEN